MTNKLENSVENLFVKEVEADGIPCIKLSSRRGFNDRLVMLPPPQCFVIEFKRPGRGHTIGKRKGEKLQLHIHKELRNIGWAVYVTDNYEEAIRLDYLKRLNERYESWIGNYNLGKLLIFDVDNIDIEENPEDLAMIIEKVNAQLHGLF